MKFCKVCVTPDTRPRVVFEENGVCNACIYSEKKSRLINWKKRDEEFLNVVKKIKEDTGENPYNCLFHGPVEKINFYCTKTQIEFSLRIIVTFAPLIPQNWSI